MNRRLVENWVESLCEKGCRSVWKDIQRLERGEPLQGMEELTDQDLQQVLTELKAIMAVYGENGCDVGFPASDVKASTS
jgi:hypothetical protein